MSIPSPQIDVTDCEYCLWSALELSRYPAPTRAGRGRSSRDGMLVFATGSPSPPWFIINFPTKRHWREPSRREDIEAGLGALAEEISSRGIRSVAIPALGCGLGGLAWGEVRPRIVRALAHLEEVDIRLYEPGPSPAVSLDEVNRRPAPCRRCGDRFTVALPAGRSEIERLARIPRDQKAELRSLQVPFVTDNLRALVSEVKASSPASGPRRQSCNRSWPQVPADVLLVEHEVRDIGIGRLVLRQDLVTLRLRAAHLRRARRAMRSHFRWLRRLLRRGLYAAAGAPASARDPPPR